MLKNVFASLALVISGAAAETIEFEGLKVKPVNVDAKIVQLHKQDVLQITKNKDIKKFDENTLALLTERSFHNGVIQVKVRSELLDDAPVFARGFVGVAFRINDNVSKFESFYLRPANGEHYDQRRRNHAVQYFSYPKYKFDTLRESFPGLYESYADVALNEWVQLKIVVEDERASFFINDDVAPALIVNNLLGGSHQGQIGLWADVGTIAFFKDFNVEYEEDLSKSAQAVKLHLKRDDRAKDEAEDATRKPVEMIDFLGIRSGDKILDVGAGGGYVTEIFSAAVGENGRVIAQNDSFATQLLDGAYVAPLYERTSNNRLPNVDVKVWEMSEIPLNEEIDLAFWGNNLHDYYHQNPGLALTILRRIYQSLKPGAIVALTDHIGDDGADNAELHRIDPAILESLLLKAGFTNLRVSNLYRTPSDPRNLSVFDKNVRGKTDRVLIKAQKPDSQAVTK